MTAIFATLWLALLLAKGTPIGRAMHRWMVEKPAALGSRIGRGGVLLIVLVAVGVSLIWWIAEADGMAMLAMGAPEIVHVLAMFEVTTWLEVAMTVLVTASATRFSGVKIAIGALFAPRAPRARRTRKVQRPPANDDDRPGFALAA